MATTPDLATAQAGAAARGRDLERSRILLGQARAAGRTTGALEARVELDEAILAVVTRRLRAVERAVVIARSKANAERARLERIADKAGVVGP